MDPFDSNEVSIIRIEIWRNLSNIYESIDSKHFIQIFFQPLRFTQVLRAKMRQTKNLTMSESIDKVCDKDA